MSQQPTITYPVAFLLDRLVAWILSGRGEPEHKSQCCQLIQNIIDGPPFDHDSTWEDLARCQSDAILPLERAVSFLIANDELYEAAPLPLESESYLEVTRRHLDYGYCPDSVAVVVASCPFSLVARCSERVRQKRCAAATTYEISTMLSAMTDQLVAFHDSLVDLQLEVLPQTWSECVECMDVLARWHAQWLIMTLGIERILNLETFWLS